MRRGRSLCTSAETVVSCDPVCSVTYDAAMADAAGKTPLEPLRQMYMRPIETQKGTVVGRIQMAKVAKAADSAKLS